MGDEYSQAISKHLDLPEYDGRGGEEINRIPNSCLVERARIGHLKEYGLLGKSITDSHIYLNTHIPFASVCVGNQGTGKSHTLACIIENCMIPLTKPRGFTQLKSP